MALLLVLDTLAPPGRLAFVLHDMSGVSFGEIAQIVGRPSAAAKMLPRLPPAVIVAGDREYPMVARCAADMAARTPASQQIAALGADHLLPLRATALIADLAGKTGGQVP